MVRLLITDLDDTLYSWIGFFIPAFYEMVDELSTILGIESEQLIKEYKIVHQEKGSVEYPYATISLPSVHAAYPSYTQDELMRELDPVFHRFNSSRKRNLKLFPTVHETLHELSNNGITIVGYTESAEENGFYRLKRLGIDRYFDKVFVSDSQFDANNILFSSDKTRTVHGQKPAPDLLKQICANEDVATNEAIYIGDSITKDIYMAKTAHVTSVLFRSSSGSNEYQDYYKKLVAISHWTRADFEREAKLKKICENDGIKPDFTITSFDSLIDIVQQINCT